MGTGEGREGNEAIGRAVARAEGGRDETSNATEGGGESRPAVQTPHVGNGLSRSRCRSGISHHDERASTQSRDASPMEVNRSHAPPWPQGTGSGSRRADRPARGEGRGWRGCLTQVLRGRGGGGEVEPGENERMSGGTPPPLPEGAAPGSQYPREAADHVSRLELQGRSTHRQQIG